LSRLTFKEKKKTVLLLLLTRHIVFSIHTITSRARLPEETAGNAIVDFPIFDNGAETTREIHARQRTIHQLLLTHDRRFLHGIVCNVV